MHPRNKHQGRYDFNELIKTFPDLGAFVKPTIHNDLSIDFFDPKAVIALNKALLKHYYFIHNWEIPENYLCPPIPGRANYIHYTADLLATCNNNIIPIGNHIKCLDIGVGANCIYPIIGTKEYGWSFVGTEIDSVSINSISKIIENNPHLKTHIEIRLQPNKLHTFQGIIQKDEKFDLSICNPPFHASLEEALETTTRKLKNLKQKKVINPIKNFGGQKNELWCDGGEERFTRDMIYQSKQFTNSVLWFTTLISKESNLKNAYNILKKTEAIEVKTIQMNQGNKKSRIIAWTFHSKEKQNEWVNTRWNDLVNID